MNCHAHREALLDLARGVDMPAAVFDAIQAHLQRCPACAAELRRQEELTTILRELSEEAGEWTAPASLEERLQAALPATSGGGASSLEGPRRTFPWWTLAAAAMVVLLSWVAMRAVRTTPPASLEPRGGVATRPPIAAPRSSPTAARPAVAQSTATPPATERAVIRTSGRSRARPAVAQPARSVEFIAIPAAAGLPALESATIVRTELPLSALPTYGVTISPDARRSAVEADLLVGQDGQARAIRLVTAQHLPDRPRSGQ